MELLPAPGGGLTKAGFDLLYERQHRRLWLLAAGLTGRAADADDVLQEALMLAFGKRAKFSPVSDEEADGAAFSAWVGRFVRNVASNYTRRRQRIWKRRNEGVDPAEIGKIRTTQEQHAEVEAAALAGAIPEAQESFDDQVSKALSRIKPIWRTCLLMNVVGGLTQAEIAQVLKMRENTVASHIRRGRERMRELLEPPSGNQASASQAGQRVQAPPAEPPGAAESAEPQFLGSEATFRSRRPEFSSQTARGDRH